MDEPTMQELHQQLVASLVDMGRRLAAVDGIHQVMGADDFHDWYVAEGQELLARRTGRRLPAFGLFLVVRAAEVRPAWLDPAAVDLGDDLAGQLIELAHDLRETS